MKLSKIYSNDPDVFKPISFENGLNFILAEDHSVGKSTLFKLIDYCLFKSKPNFLSIDRFKDLSFFLEILVGNDLYITIKRCVSGKANNCIKLSNTSIEAVGLEEEDYDFKGGENKAVDFLNDKSEFILPSIRHYITYFLRDQDNQSDVFRLNKFQRSNDIDYKPVVANLLGMDGDKIKDKYLLEDKISNKSDHIKLFEIELSGYKTKDLIEEEKSIIAGQLKDKESTYSKFDFYLAEHNISQELVFDIELKVSKLNRERNSIKREIDYINKALRTKLSIAPEDIAGLFNDIKIHFPDDLKANYEQVIEFNQQITEEREDIFKDNLTRYTETLSDIEKELTNLNEKRKSLLGILNESDPMNKFKLLESEIVELKYKISDYDKKLDVFNKIEVLNREIRDDKLKLNGIVSAQDSLVNVDALAKIKAAIKTIGRLVFRNRELAFSVGFNTANNLEFNLKIANKDGFNNLEEDGNTVKKLLCFVFSSAVAVARNDDHFFKFVAFDSPFDGDKNVWQNGIYEALKYLARNDIQTIVTTITDEVKEPGNLSEIKETYVRRLLTADDKLLGDF